MNDTLEIDGLVIGPAYVRSLKAENAKLRAALKSAWGFVNAHDNVGQTRELLRELLSCAERERGLK